jgi:hypothetical protein
MGSLLMLSTDYCDRIAKHILIYTYCYHLLNESLSLPQSDRIKMLKL